MNQQCGVDSIYLKQKSHAVLSMYSDTFAMQLLCSKYQGIYAAQHVQWCESCFLRHNAPNFYRLVPVDES